MNNKICCFAGHRNDWHSIGVEEKLFEVIENLINKGVNIFYDGGYGAFDKKCSKVVLQLKQKYKHIKLIRVLAYYQYDKQKFEIPDGYDETIFPDIEEVYYKQRITKRNQWIVKQSNYIVCHIENTFNSGAYKTIKYAQKLGKEIIYI